MPRGSKSKYTSKQKRQAQHVESSEKKRGRSSGRAKQIAYATVNKQDGGGKKAGGGGRGRKPGTSSSRKPSRRSTRSKS